MNQPSGNSRKPTKAQRAVILRALATPDETLDAGSARRDVEDRVIEAGWIDRYTSKVTDAGKLAVGRADLIALPDVEPGDVLVYRTHPGCAVRVVLVRNGGRAFDAEYVTVCADCGGVAMPVRPTPGGIFAHAAYLLRHAYPSDVRGILFTTEDRWRAAQDHDNPDWSDVDTRLAYELVKARQDATPTQQQADDDEPRCPTCGEPEWLLASGAVGHCGDEHGNDCPTPVPPAEPAPVADTERAEAVAAIRALADWIESHPEAPVPRSACAQHTIHDGTDDEKRAAVEAVARVLGVERTEWENGTSARVVVARIGCHDVTHTVHAALTDVSAEGGESL
jgi:hypothetical protein